MLGFKSYRCCGCERAFSAASAVYTYNKVCICADCFEKLEQTGGKQHFYGCFYNDYTYSPFYYKDLYRDIFLSFKFKNNPAFGHLLGMAAADCLSSVSELGEYDCIVPVPLSRERYNERGYNQSEILAGYMDAEIKPYLERIRHSPAQSAAAVGVRAENVRGAFRAEPCVAGKRLILFDDVHTTGSTLYECERMLREAGAESVCLVTAAYVYHPTRDRIY